MEKLINGLLKPKTSRKELEEKKKKLQQEFHEACEARDFKRSDEIAKELYNVFVELEK